MIGIISLLAVATASAPEAAVMWSGYCEIHFKDNNGIGSMPVQYGWTVGELNPPFIIIPAGSPLEAGKFFLKRTPIPPAEGKPDPDVIDRFSEVSGPLGKARIEGFEDFKFHKKSRMIELKYLAGITFENGLKREAELTCSLPYPSKGERAQ